MRRTAARARQDAREHLAEVDPVMAALIERHGECSIRRRRGAPFVVLARSVVSQMISTKAARTVFARVEAAVGEPLSAARTLQTPLAKLRKAGLSGNKAKAILALAKLAEEEDLRGLGRRSNERIHEALIAVPGVGEWTVNMFLMFHLARPDVFPAKDLGVLEGMRRAYGLKKRPRSAEARERAKPWAPYRSTAAWYLWRACEE